MRLRFRSITYAVGGTPASLERHYRELRESMLRAGAHYGLQSGSPWRPPIDIHETPEAIIIKMELAGVGEDDINITLYDNALVVSGHRENDIPPDESVYYHEAQVRYGPFRADVFLPLPVDHNAVQATYDSGFLRVRLPKVEQANTREEEGVATGIDVGAKSVDAAETSRPTSEKTPQKTPEGSAESPLDASARDTGAIAGRASSAVAFGAHVAITPRESS